MSLDEPTDVRFTTLEQYVRDQAAAAFTAGGTAGATEPVTPRRAGRPPRRRCRLRIVRKKKVQLDGADVPLDGTAEAKVDVLRYLAALISADGNWSAARR
jgi:hypothetical protein